MVVDIPKIKYEQMVIEIYVDGKRDYEAEERLYNEVIRNGIALAHSERNGE